MPEEPRVCDTKPMMLEVGPGVHWWCSCGHSSHQPFCDGSHKGTGLQPVKFECTEATTVRWCLCKHSATPPVCDGTHMKFRP